MRHFPLPMIFAAAFMAVQGPLPASAASGDLGSNLAGEACRMAGAQAQDIVCGAATVPAGAVHLVPLNAALPAAEPARRAAIASAVRQISSAGAPNAMNCDGGKSLDANTLLFVCSLGDANWPHIVLASASARTLVLADGLPGMIPVLLVAVAQSGAAVSAPQLVTSAVQAAFPARVLTAGAGDYSGYRQFMDLGSRQSAGGDYAAAEAAYRNALDIETRLFGQDSAAVGATLLELALQVSNQQRFAEAAALLQRATPIIESSPAPSIRARLASYRGLDAANQRNYVAALRYAHDDVVARQADVDRVLAGGLDLNGNLPVVPLTMQGELVHALRIEAEMAMRLDDMAGAQAAAEQALYIITAHPDLPLAWRPDIVLLMGEINAGQGRVVVAERDLTEALAMDQRLFGEGGPTINAQLQLGKFYAGEQLYPASITAYRAAFSALAKDPVARSHIAADQLVPFLAAATASDDSAGRARLDEEIFAASQIADSDVAGQTIARVAARRAADTPALAEEVRSADAAMRARDDLRLQLAAEHAKAGDQRDAARERTLAEALAAAVSKSDALAAKLRADFPAYTALADPGAVSLTALQGVLRPREGFVSFVIGVRASYVLLITHDRLIARPIPATRDSLAADIADLRKAFTPQLGRPPEFSLTGAAALYRQLLGPVAPELAGVDHLVVAASGDLASLPFSLLVTGDPGAARDYAHATWLIRQAAVSEIPSARAFMALRSARASAAPRPFLGVGNPVFAGNAGGPAGQALGALASACQEGASANPDLLRALPPLPDTAAEVQAVGRDLNAGQGDILLGADASETALRAKPLDQYAVLYFATHGMLPGELHCQAQPGLVLTPPAAAGAADADGLLTASEIAGLKLNAQLVVLSACNTAAAGGSQFGGGALEGLADSFFDAGAHAVLASHWEVPSAATTSLMTALFARLAQDPNHDAAEALRQAQLSLIAQDPTAHPFDWAAFTLIGSGA